MRLIVSAKGLNIKLAEKNRVEFPRTSSELGVSLYHTFLVNLFSATLRAPVSATKSTPRQTRKRIRGSVSSQVKSAVSHVYDAEATTSQHRHQLFPLLHNLTTSPVPSR